jgi:TolB-like protein
VAHFAGKKLMGFLCLLSTGHVNEYAVHDTVKYPGIVALATRRYPADDVADDDAKVDFIGSNNRACVLAAAAAALFFLHSKPASSPAQPVASRAAVLPFDTLSDGAEARHFADALTDEIVTGLNSNRIQVVSRDDAATLRGSDRDRKVAELGVALLFDGTVQDDGKTVKIRVHLDDPVRHVTLWSGGAKVPQSAVTNCRPQSLAQSPLFLPVPTAHWCRSMALPTPIFSPATFMPATFS